MPTPAAPNPSPTDEPPIPRKPPGQRADWLAWSLQLLLGLFVGGIAGALMGNRMMRLYFIGVEELHLVVAGAALFGGAIASYRGEDTWTTRSALDPERPIPASQCRSWSIAIGSVGILTFSCAVIRHLHIVGWRGGHFSPSVGEVILLLVGILLAWQLVHAWRTATIFTVYGPLERDEAPFAFWFWVAGASLGALFILIRLL